jgi:ribulose bisphosphate carboxylase small subunit
VKETLDVSQNRFLRGMIAALTSDGELEAVLGSVIDLHPERREHVTGLRLVVRLPVPHLRVRDHSRRLTQGTFSSLPDLTDDEITAQIAYALGNGWPCSVEFTDDPHPRNVYWEMWGLPMFDLADPAGVLQEINDCRRAYPAHYIRLNAYDAGLDRGTRDGVRHARAGARGGRTRGDPARGGDGRPRPGTRRLPRRRGARPARHRPGRARHGQDPHPRDRRAPARRPAAGQVRSQRHPAEPAHVPHPGAPAPARRRSRCGWPSSCTAWGTCAAVTWWP